MNVLQILKDSCRESPLLAIGLGFFVYLLGMALFVPMIGGLLSLLTQMSFDELQELVKGNLGEGDAGPHIFRTFQASVQIFTWGLAAVVVAWLCRGVSIEFGWDKPIPFMHILLAILIMIAALPLIGLLSFDADTFALPDFLKDFEDWTREAEASSNKILVRLIGDPRSGILVLNVFVFALVPAVCEELFFRAMLQRNLAKVYNPHLAIFIASFIFSFIHLQFFGFFPRLLLGVLLGYFFYLSGNVTLCIIAHFAFNFTSVLGSWYAARTTEITPEALAQGPDFSPVAMILSAAILGILFFVYFRQAAPLMEEATEGTA